MKRITTSEPYTVTFNVTVNSTNINFELNEDAEPEYDSKDHWAQFVEELWSRYDTDGTGDLDFYQAKKMFNAVFSGCPPGEFNRKFALMDTNDDGKISKQEMTNYVKQHINDYDEF